MRIVNRNTLKYSCAWVLFVSSFLRLNASDHDRIDSLYNAGAILGLSDLNSFHKVINQMFSYSKKTGYEYGQIKGKLLSSFYYLTWFKLDTANLQFVDFKPKKFEVELIRRLGGLEKGEGIHYLKLGFERAMTL